MNPRGRFRRQWQALECTAALVFLCATNALAQELSFNRDIRPILADRCFPCHGADTSQRKARLRLDRAGGADGAYRSHDGSTAIKPGSLKNSELWSRITASDADEVMPPPKARKKRKISFF